jgi:hypothetical protein
MMKRKTLQLRDTALFKWHMLAFIIFAIMVSYSIIATITYPGNATVPFAAFRPFIIERVSLIIIWGILLLLHYSFHHIRAIQQMRDYRAHQDLLSRITRQDDSRLRLDSQPENFEVIEDEPGWLDEEEYRSQSRHQRR